MKKLIVIGDVAKDSLTRQEIRSAVEGFLTSQGAPSINFVSSQLSTIHTSFLLNQIVEIEERYGKASSTVVFQNTDPRLSTKEKLETPRGAEFLILRLQSDILVCGPNAGYDFSLLKDKIKVAFVYKGLNEGTQFRSRDLYSRICAHLMDDKEKELDLEEVSADVVPNLQGYFVGHVDNFGNIKTTIKKSDLKGKYEIGDKVKVKIGRSNLQAEYTHGLFSGEVGKLSIYAGSSGDQNDPFLEIAVWIHSENEKSAEELFKSPKPGDEIKLS